MRRAPIAFLGFLFSFTLLSVTACGSSGDTPQVTPDTDPGETDPDTEPPPDVPEWEEPTSPDKVLILNIYQPGVAGPNENCFGASTGIGKYGLLPDSALAPCGKTEVCYLRTDGWVAYHNEDCIPEGSFLANWKKLPYSDLGPCEVPKHMNLKIALCPKKSCTWARDITIDTKRGCATTIESKGCRGTDFAAPTSCFCSKTNADLVYIAADPKATTAPDADFSPCSDANAACKKALGMVDTTAGCTTGGGGDAGTD